MSLFGKILIVLNCIVAAIFFYLAVLDFGQKEKWADNYLQHDLMIRGLPYDAKEPDVRSDPKVDNLRDPLVKQMLSKVGGESVRTQEDEVKKVQARILSSIDNLPTPKDKVSQQVRILKALADTQNDRDFLANEGELKSDELQLKIDAAFAKALINDNQAPYSERKILVADQLLRLCDVLRLEEAEQGKPAPSLIDSKAYQRFQVVVGVERAAAALDHFATAKRQFAIDIKDGIDRDRNRFAYDHRQLLDQIAMLSARLRDVDDYLARQKTLEADKTAQVAAIEKLRDELQKTLQDKRSENASLLANQKAYEEALFKARQELRDSFVENQQLEQTLKSLEKSR